MFVALDFAPHLLGAFFIGLVMIYIGGRALTAHVFSEIWDKEIQWTKTLRNRQKLLYYFGNVFALGGFVIYVTAQALGFLLMYDVVSLFLFTGARLLMYLTLVPLLFIPVMQFVNNALKVSNFHWPLTQTMINWVAPDGV